MSVPGLLSLPEGTKWEFSQGENCQLRVSLYVFRVCKINPIMFPGSLSAGGGVGVGGKAAPLKNFSNLKMHESPAHRVQMQTLIRWVGAVPEVVHCLQAPRGCRCCESRGQTPHSLGLCF